jgi:uncharacterized protein
MRNAVLSALQTKHAAATPRTASADGLFDGYASLFGVPDLSRDVVVSGAFAESLSRRGAGAIRMLWQHDPGEPIGRWLDIREDSRGLYVRGRLNLAVARAREIHALLRDGALDGLSIGFKVERARRERGGGLRRLEKLDLWEISLVTFPMLPGARVSALKTGAAAVADLAHRIGAAARRLRASGNFSGNSWPSACVGAGYAGPDGADLRLLRDGSLRRNGRRA